MCIFLSVWMDRKQKQKMGELIRPFFGNLHDPREGFARAKLRNFDRKRDD